MSNTETTHTGPAVAGIAADASPIFILAAPGSHSSLAAAMIGRHPACFGAPELNLFVAETLEDIALRLSPMRQTQFHGLLRMVSYLWAGEQNIDTVEMARRWLMRRLNKNSAEVFEELRRKVAPLRLVDPSRSYSVFPECLPRIRDAYPNACFVRLMHEGEDAAIESDIVPEMEGVVRATRDALLAFFAALAPAQAVTVAVDRLLHAPEAELPPLCHALGLLADDDAIEAMLHPERSPFAGFGPLGANLGNEPAFLRDPLLPRVAAHEDFDDGAPARLVGAERRMLVEGG